MATSLRLLAPAADANATVTVVRDGAAAGATGQPQTVALTAGIPLQLDLSGLEIGTYTVAVLAHRHASASGSADGIRSAGSRHLAGS